MTAAASCTPRSSTTNKPPPPPRSGAAPPHGSPTIGITCERVITDNGACYRSGLWHHACAATGTTVKKTRPCRPQTNGKVERYHRILLEEWAYIRPWTSEHQRAAAYARLRPLLQSPPIPRRTRMGNTHQHPQGARSQSSTTRPPVRPLARWKDGVDGQRVDVGVDDGRPRRAVRDPADQAPGTAVSGPCVRHAPRRGGAPGPGDRGRDHRRRWQGIGSPRGQVRDPALPAVSTIRR